MFSSILLAWQLFNAPIVYAKERMPEPTREEVIAEIQRVFPKVEWQNAKKIAECESNFENIQSLAIYPKDNLRLGIKAGEKEESYGVFQIFLPVRPHFDKDRLLNDYKFNIEIAYKIWSEEGGWKNWYNCSKRMGVNL